MTPKKYVRWSQLIGAIVEIREHGQTIRTGRVEEVMPDSSALWLASDGDNPRTMYEASRGYQAWVEPQELTGTSSYRMTTSMLYPDGAA